MSLEVQTLTRGRETEYSDFLKSIEHAMMYYSLSYRNFLRNVLKDSVDAYFIAYRQGEIIGVLPSFMKINDTYGNVLNALSFYGSNGGIIVSENGNNSLEVKKKTFGVFVRLYCSEFSRCVYDYLKSFGYGCKFL